MKTFLRNRMRQTAGAAGWGVAGSAVLVGCALPPATPELDARFGQATRNARLAQQLPAAVASPGSGAAAPSPAASGVAGVPGLDGVAAVHAVRQVRETFRHAPGREPTSQWVGGSAAP